MQFCLMAPYFQQIKFSAIVLFFMYVTLCPLSFCNHLDGEERAGCSAWFVFQVSPDCCVALLAVPCVCLQLVILVFPDHSYLLYRYGMDLSWKPNIYMF